MNLQLKQRLVGAIVLVSIAVILIPMMLDGNDSRRMPTDGSNVPAMPDYEFEAMEIPLRLPQGEERVERQSAPADTPAEEPPVTAEKTPEPSPTPRQQAKIERKPLVSGTDTVETVKVEPQPAAKPAPKPATKPVSPPEEGDAWVVQLGSFSSAGNANALRDKVKQQGFEVYVQKHSGDKGTSYRVRVGPVTGRTQAEALRDRIESKMQIRGMPMPRSS